MEPAQQLSAKQRTVSFQNAQVECVNRSDTLALKTVKFVKYV